MRATDLESQCGVVMEPTVTRGWDQASEEKKGIAGDGKSQDVKDLGTQL